MKKQPLVAITGADIIYKNDQKSPLHVVREKYFQLLKKGKLCSSLIFNTNDQNILECYLNRFDALLLTGGGDIHPKFYKQRMSQQVGTYDMEVDPTRDQTEIYLIKQFLKQKKPVLGICRGAQVINVALGGSLIQDLNNNQISPKEVHLVSDSKGGWYERPHQVNIVPDSNLMKIIKTTKFFVNSVHHQIIDKPGKNLVTSAYSPEGVIEAIEYPSDSTFLIGVQWHLEQMQEHASTKKLISAFSKAIYEKLS